MKISLPDNRDVGEAVGDSNEGMKEARDKYDARQKAIMDESMEDSLLRQNMISAGSDFKGRPQDEGYRPNKGTARERATAEGAYDSDKITESGDQGFGGAGSSRTVKATPKAMPKAKPETSQIGRPKVTVQDTGSDVARMANRGKPVAAPPDNTTESVTDRAKAARDRARSGSDSTDNRSVNERLRSVMGSSSDAADKAKGIGASVSNYFKNFKTPAERKAQEQKEKAAKGSYSSGGSVSSASKRADGIATKGKTRGRMC